MATLRTANFPPNVAGVGEEEEGSASPPPPAQEFEGSGDRASAGLAARKVGNYISAHGLNKYLAASEGHLNAAHDAAKNARQEALREFALERGLKVTALMEKTKNLDPADALPFGFVTKLRDGHGGGVTHCTWADDGQHIASCSLDGSVVVWDTKTCTVKRSYVGHTGPVLQVVFSPVGDNDRLASCGRDRTVRLWAKRSGKQLFTFREQRCAVTCLSFCHDGSLLASGGEDGSILVYNMERLEREAMERRVGLSVDRLEDLEDISRVIQGGELVGLEIEGYPGRGEGHAGPLAAVAWSPKDECIASAGEDRVIKVWSLPDGGALKCSCEGHLATITALAFTPHPGGRVLASASLDGSVRLWGWRGSKGGECLRVLLSAPGVFSEGHMGGVTCLAWTLEGGGGGRLLSAGCDRSVVVWNPKTGVALQTLPGIHRQRVSALAMCPDGLHFATSSLDTTVGVFGAQPLVGWEAVGAALGGAWRRMVVNCARGASVFRGALYYGGGRKGESVGAMVESAAAKYTPRRRGEGEGEGGDASGSRRRRRKSGEGEEGEEEEEEREGEGGGEGGASRGAKKTLPLGSSGSVAEGVEMGGADIEAELRSMVSHSSSKWGGVVD